MNLQEPDAKRQLSTAMIGSAAGHVAVPRAHERAGVAELFAQYEALVDSCGSDDAKHALAQRICALLAAHEGNGGARHDAVARPASDGRGELDDGECRGATAQELIERIGSMEADDARAARKARSLDGA